ncbi:MAG: hypothetical protein ACRDVP_02040 [Acidimicrobiales bacterium]
MLYPTLVASACVVAGILILIETFFFFGHQGTAAATAAMVLGAILIVSPAWALVGGHLLHTKPTAQRVPDGASLPVGPMVEGPTREGLNQEVTAEVRRQLALVFSGFSAGEGATTETTMTAFPQAGNVESEGQRAS